MLSASGEKEVPIGPVFWVNNRREGGKKSKRGRKKRRTGKDEYVS